MSNKKEKNTRDLSQERIKAQKEKFIKQKETYKERVRPLVKFLRSKKLRFEHAQVGSERVEYFRIDQYQKIVEDSKQYIATQPALSALIKNAFDQFVFFKRPINVKVKYPKNIEPVLQSDPEKKYASFRFDTTESRTSMTILIIITVLALVMFPIWPYELKYGIWWVSLVLLIVLVGIIVIRLLVFLVFAIFNYHIWIFPNLFYSTGFFDSFIPVLEIIKGEKSWYSLFVRLSAIGIFLTLATHIYLNPTFLDDNIAFTKQTISEVHDWGVKKIKNQGKFAEKAITNLNEILNQTADVADDQMEKYVNETNVKEETDDVTDVTDDI